LSRLDKALLLGGSFKRLPSLLPSSTKDNSEKLIDHLIQISDDDRNKLSKMHVALIKTSVTGQNNTKLCTTWFVFQKFDASTPEIMQELKNTSNPVILVIGIAFPADTNNINGSASCFLPIGNMSTKFPVHINASFNVLKNRRDIWLPCPSLGNNGDKHVQWARWNDILIRFALPHLWKESIEYLVSSTILLMFASQKEIQSIIYARLPDLSTMQE